MTDEIELRIQDLSERAQKALALVLAGKPMTVASLRTISARDIWIMPGFGRATSDEVQRWARRHGVEMP